MKQCHERQKEIVTAGYDRCARRYNGDRSSAAHPILDGLLARLPTPTSSLDIGCGGGVPVTAMLAARGPVVGVDISPVQIEHARRQVRSAELIAGDIMDQTFAEASFDAIVSFYAVFHLPRAEHRCLLERCVRWLRSSGHLVLTLGEGDHVGYTEPDFFGAEMYWSHHPSGWYRDVLLELGMEIVEEDAVGHGYADADADADADERHPYIIARKT